MSSFPSAPASTSTDPDRDPRRSRDPSLRHLLVGGWRRLVVLASLALTAAESARAAQGDPELELARQPALYVVVDPSRATVDVKIRGKAFVSLALQGWGFFVYSEDSDASLPEVTLPEVLSVVGDPAAASRRIATIEGLRPLDDDAEEPKVATTGAPPVPAPITEFEVPLDGGWILHVGPQLPPTGGLAGWRARLADGWAAVRGRPVPRPSLLALVLDPAQARRLCHVLRPGTRVLVLDSAQLPSAAADDGG